MKALLSFIFFSLLITFDINAQQHRWVDISNKITTASTTNFCDVHFLSANYGILSSGNQSEVYTTTDGGLTFSNHTVPNNDFLNSVQMLSSSEYFGGSQLNRIYRSSDGGNTWVSLGSTGNPVRSITCFPSSSTLYSCGDHGSSYSITSGGITNLPTGLASNLRSVTFPANSEGWFCGGAIIRHFANGIWNGDQTYPAYGYNAISFVNNTTGWAVGDAGVIIHTTNGTNWMEQTNPDVQSPKRTLNDVFFLNENEGWAVGDGGVILHTTNGGNTWVEEGAGLTTNLLSSVYFTSSTNGYIAGNNKTLLKFSETSQPAGLVDMSDKIPLSGNLVTLTDVQKVGNTLWISCSSSPVIFRSTDGGNNFTSAATASVSQAIYMFPDGINGWAVGLAKGNKTTDGGQSWSNPNTTIGGTLYDVYFPTSLTGYAVGNSGVVYKTENGGTGWTLKTQPFNASILSVAFPGSSDPNTGYVALSNAITTLYKTTDGGSSWNYMTLPGISSSMNCLEFSDANTGWAAGGNGEIFSYKNGIWTKQTTPVTTTLNGISFASDGLNGWAAGNNGVMLHTTNGGIEWNQEGSGLTTQNLTKVDVISSTEAYIVGYGKTFIKYSDTPTGINNTFSESSSFNLEQNFPNPFNQATNISYSLTVPGKVRLSVYNLFGNQVAILVNEYKPTGNFSTTFSAGKLLSGIYYYQLQLGGMVKTRNMMIVK